MTDFGPTPLGIEKSQSALSCEEPSSLKTAHEVGVLSIAESESENEKSRKNPLFLIAQQDEVMGKGVPKGPNPLPKGAADREGEFGPTFSKGWVDNEQILSELFEEIDLKRECVHLLKKLNAVVGEPRKELIRILRLKRDRLKVLNPSLFTRVEFDKEHEKIISDVVLKCECGPL